MQVIKKINNNVAIGLDEKGKQAILLGTGIGFPKVPYQLVNLNKVEKIFYNLDAQYISLIGGIPEEILQIAARITELASEQIEKILNPNLVMTLADHLSFAVHRFENNLHLDSPLAPEVMRLYEEEVKIGEIGLELVKERLRIDLPYSEAISIALHIVNAEATAFDMQNTVKDTKILATAIKIIENDYRIDFSKNERAFLRLKTHLLLLLKSSPEDQRHQAVSENNKSLSKVFKQEFPDVVRTVRKIEILLQNERDWILNEDEKLYLMIHINRIIQASNEE